MCDKFDVEDASSPKDVDEGQITSRPLSEKEDRRLLRRIDMFLLPVMALSYMFQYLDKAALSFTAILGLRDDLNLQGSQYSWASSVYYFGYMIASYPAGILMVYLSVSKVITGSVFLWGAILMLTAVCYNPAGLLANRFFLGVAEAAVAPGLSIIVSMWYKRSEQPLRQAAWFLGNTCAGIFGGVLSYAIAHIEGFTPWKAVFLIFGAFTVAWSVGIFFLLPDLPIKAWFLSKDDRAKAVARVEENMTGIKSDKFEWYQCVEALLDAHSWLLFIIQISGQIANGGVQSFGSIVIEGFGFSTFTTLLVQMLGYVFQLIFVLLATLGSTYLPNTRTYWMAFDLAVAIAGGAMIREISPEYKWARFFGYCLTMGYTPNFPIILSMFSANVGGFTKKVTVNAMIFIAYCAGNIIGPQLFFESEAPSYDSGFLAIMICYGVGIVMCFVLRFYLIWENRRRDRAGGAALETTESYNGTLNEMNKTDKEIPQFRYAY